MTPDESLGACQRRLLATSRGLDDLTARHAELVAAARELMDLLLRGPKCVDCGKGGYLRPDGKFVDDRHQPGCRVAALRAALAREEEGKE